MAHATALAKKTADVLKATGNDCALNGCTITLARWNVRVDVEEGRENESSGFVRIFPNIITRHRLLPRGFARELGVGMGRTLQDAVDSVSATWMILFFPLLKFVFEDHPHDCLVHDVNVHLPRADNARYRLFAGPLQIFGVEGLDGEKHYGQTLLWDAFSDQLLTTLNPGVHHVRCYTGRTSERVNGDVFVDGREWPEGSELLRRLGAQTLPMPADSFPMCAFKQHLIIRPEDLAAGSAAEREAQVGEWREAIADRVSEAHRPLLTSLLRGLFVMSRFGNEAEHARELAEAGEPGQTVGELLAFAQSAAARVILGNRIGFSATYYWSNYRTRRAAQRRYDQTSLFVAAIEVYGLLNQLSVATEEVTALSQCSAEFGVVAQLAEKKVPLEGARISIMFHPTDELVEGEDLDALMVRPEPQPVGRPRGQDKKKPWWRRW